LDSYFLEPNQAVVLSLYNGTFEKSENIITRDRILDASIITQGERLAIDQRQWKDQDSTITYLNFKTGKAGTYVSGVSTKARNIELSAEDFNNYLEHDGVLDVLEERKNNGTLDQDAIESYEKHVKAIYQVGHVRTDDWSTILGYPLEFVPRANPYDKYTGEKLNVQLLIDGTPLSNQLVYANYIKTEHTHAHDAHSHSHEHWHAHKQEEQSHSHDSHTQNNHTYKQGQQLRTDEKGMVSVELPEDGIYYLRTIHMTKATDSEKLTHRSKWATWACDVTHKHDATTHTHDKDHSDGMPAWIFILGSLLIVGVLFFIFRRSNS
jgi:hypothetical protein